MTLTEAQVPASGRQGSRMQARGFATEQTASGRTTSRGPVSYTSLALTLATGMGLLYVYRMERERKLKALLSQTEQAGTAAIGGPFELVDQNGRAFGSKDLLGKFALLYFGFTHCPDICPEELEKMAKAMDLVGKDTEQDVQCVFLTLDPERDSVAQVKNYIQEFSPNFIGLTGSQEQVKSAARAYRVYYTKTDDSPEDYLIDHSIIMYLLNPKGEFVTFYGKNYTAETLADSVKGFVKNWQTESQ
ncbi:hypothetical protein WJX73_005158 [Symbiochloris irregularis]|uniref:Thioredoxin domain-containing protein n=1 Tax=Symbiochloris irregularis TaxID=706552 RepID=A0AAW1PBN2_9CHLO